MKAVTLITFFLGCAALTYAGHDSDSSSSSSSSESDNTSEKSKHSSWSGSRYRSASCRFVPAVNGSGDVNGYIHIYQKRAGEPVWIKGGLTGIGGPAGTSYALAFHQGSAATGCAGIGGTMQNVGGDVTHLVAKAQNSVAGIKERSSTISLEEGAANSIIGHSMALREVTSGNVDACCGIVKNRGRE